MDAVANKSKFDSGKNLLRTPKKLTVAKKASEDSTQSSEEKESPIMEPKMAKAPHIFEQHEEVLIHYQGQRLKNNV